VFIHITLLSGFCEHFRGGVLFLGMTKTYSICGGKAKKARRLASSFNYPVTRGVLKPEREARLERANYVSETKATKSG
jgi:6,7-dimethyl-8-ribityllumazine synthase